MTNRVRGSAELLLQRKTALWDFIVPAQLSWDTWARHLQLQCHHCDIALAYACDVSSPYKDWTSLSAIYPLLVVWQQGSLQSSCYDAIPICAAAVCDLIWLHQWDGGQQGTPQRMACTFTKGFFGTRERRLARTATCRNGQLQCNRGCPKQGSGVIQRSPGRQPTSLEYVTPDTSQEAVVPVAGVGMEKSYSASAWR